MLAPESSALFQKGFALTAKLLLKKDFGAIYLSNSSDIESEESFRFKKAPLFIYSNHSAWHDALLAPEVCVNFLKRRSIGPMDKEQFKKFKSLRKVGIFGVGKGDGPSAQLLIDNEFKKDPSTCVWIHPEGVFNASTTKVKAFKEGLSRWSNQEGYMRVPLAIRYAFGPEPRPAIFLKFGRTCPARGLSVDEDSEYLREELERVLKELNSEVRKAYSGSKADLKSFRRIL